MVRLRRNRQRRSKLRYALQRNHGHDLAINEKNYHILDTANSDMLYNDSVGCLVYPWYSLSVAGISEPPRSKYTCMASLKQLCLVQTALLADSLTADHLGMLLWKGNGKLLWNKILELQTDSFYVFLLFYSRFGENSDFRCHWQNDSSNRNSPAGLRQFALNACTIGLSRRHRLENILSNIDYEFLTTQINNLGDGVRSVLDLSRCSSGLSSYSFLNLLKINLVWALNLSNCDHVNDNILRIMSKSDEGILRNLQVLKIVNCSNITIRGLETLMLSQHSNLKYIESNLGLALEPFHFRYELGKLYVLGTKWNCLESTSKEYKKLDRSFEFASTSLVKQFPEIFDTKKTHIVLDVTIFNECILDQGDLRSRTMKTWESRLQNSIATRISLTSFMYLNEGTQDSRSEQLKRKPHKVQKTKKVLKKKAQTAQEYFGL